MCNVEQECAMLAAAVAPDIASAGVSASYGTCGGFMIVLRFSPVSSGLFSRRIPNTRSAHQQIPP
jgi:hypothetical protein